MKMTSKILKAKGACTSQVLEFRERWPRGLTLTSEEQAREVALIAAQVFDWDWAAQNLLSPEGRREFRRVAEPALQEYLRVDNAAFQEYLRIKDAARQEYLRVIEPARQEYLRIKDAAWQEFENQCAVAFAELLFREHTEGDV